MSDVFISYKRRLRPQVERIAVALRELRIDVWFDAALEPGVSFSAEISNEVRNAGCVLVCFSDDAFPHGGDENGWVLGEASIGRKRGRLVTVMLDETEFDPPWNMIHTERLVGFDPADFSADRSGWRGALAAIGRMIERPGLADYDRAVAVGTAEAFKGWVQTYPRDVLAESVWARVEELELAQVRKRLAEERVKPAEPTITVPSKPEVPERVYAPLPEQIIEPAAPAPTSAPAASAAPPPQTAAATPPPIVEPIPMVAPPFSPPIAAAIACAVAAVGAVLLALVLGDESEGPLFIAVTFGGPAAAMAILGGLLVVSGYVKIWRAIVLALVGYVGFFAAIFTAEFLTRSAPSFGTEGADIAGGFAMGAVGALIVLFALIMLSRNPNMGRVIPISLSGVLLVGVVTALVMVFPGISLRNGNNVVWATPAWYVAMGAVLVWLLAPEFRWRSRTAVGSSGSKLKLWQIFTVGFVGIALCATGALATINLPSNALLGYLVIGLGAAMFVMPLAVLLARTHAFPVGGAIALVPVVGLIAFAIVYCWRYVPYYFGSDFETAALTGIAALVGAALTGLAIGLFARRPLDGRFWLIVTVFSVAEGLVFTILIAVLTVLAYDPIGIFVMPIVWQTVMVFALPFLLEPSRLAGAPAATG